jgi:hypothetical protein
LLTAPPTDPDVSNSLIRFVSNQKLASVCLWLTRNLPASGAQLGCPGLRNYQSSSALAELVIKTDRDLNVSPVFQSANVVPGVAFPSVGPLGLSSPPSSSFLLDDRYYASLRQPTAHFGRFASRSRSDTGCPSIQHPETDGAPELPSCPYEHMPRSKTPVVSCALAISYAGLLPTAGWKASALGTQTSTPYPMTTTIPFSGFNNAACVLAPSSSGLPLRDLPEEFATDLLAGLWSDGTCPSYKADLFP